MSTARANRVSTGRMIFRMYWKYVVCLLVTFVAQMFLPLRQAPKVLSNGYMVDLYVTMVFVVAGWAIMRMLFNSIRLLLWLRGKVDSCRNCGGILGLSRPASGAEEKMVSTCYRCGRERVDQINGV